MKDLFCRLGGPVKVHFNRMNIAAMGMSAV